MDELVNIHQRAHQVLVRLLVVGGLLLGVPIEYFDDFRSIGERPFEKLNKLWVGHDIQIFGVMGSNESQERSEGGIRSIPELFDKMIELRQRCRVIWKSEAEHSGGPTKLFIVRFNCIVNSLLNLEVIQ